MQTPGPGRSEPGPAPFTTSPGLPAYTTGPGSAAVSRVGAILFFLGLFLIAIGYFLLAAIQYQFISGSVAFSNFQQIELVEGLAQVTTGIGILFAGFGWVVDQLAMARALPSSAPSGFSEPTPQVAFIVFLIGILALAFSSFFFGYIEFAAYDNLSLNLSQYTSVVLEMLMGLGALLVAFGWLVQHLRVLARLGRTPS